MQAPQRSTHAQARHQHAQNHEQPGHGRLAADAWTDVVPVVDVVPDRPCGAARPGVLVRPRRMPSRAAPAGCSARPCRWSVDDRRGCAAVWCPGPGTQRRRPPGGSRGRGRSTAADSDHAGWQGSWWPGARTAAATCWAQTKWSMRCTGLVCSVVLISRATRPLSIVRGLPGRMSSARPAMRRHLPHGLPVVTAVSPRPGCRHGRHDQCPKRTGRNSSCLRPCP